MFRVGSKAWQRAAVFLVLATFILLTPSALMAEQAITIHIDGKVIESEVAPLIVKGRTMVPVGVIAEGLGMQVDWDGNNRRVLITTPGTDTIMPRVASPLAQRGIGIFIDGKEIKADPAPFILDDRTMVPLRVIMENLNCKVDWDGENRRVIITTSAAIDNNPVTDKDTDPGTNPSEEPIAVKDANNATNPPETPPADNEPLTDKEVPLVTNIDYQQSIMGEAKMGREKLLAVMQNNNPAAPQELVDLYLEIGKQYGIKGDIAFCQAAKETGWWKYGGLVQSYQNNYCGLGATGTAATGEEDPLGADPTKIRYEAGVHGAIFASPAIGVEAHIQHLYAYACKNPLPPGKVLVDPRFIKPTRGIAPLWIDLGGRWAYPGYDRKIYGVDFQEAFPKAFANCDTYGHSILRDYYQKVLDIKTN
ncbi:MAG: stalk domain-containing protein [Syntrophomonadaceae bacterium]|nr:stalk domain-containing protein [Syntrophomonadaceae bacterium]